MCTYGAHTNTTNILSYSFSHSVELPLGFTGVVLYLHHLCETATFTKNSLDTVQTTFQFTGAKAVPAHHFEYLMIHVFCSFLLLFLIYFSPRQHLYMTVYTTETHAFHLSPKVWSSTFSKSFQYLKITLLLHGSLHPCSHSASFLTSLTTYEGKCHYVGLYCRVQSIVCNLVRFS